MPDRYHIHTALTPGLFRRLGKYGSVDWREDCSRCSNCVKLRCVYDVYEKEATHSRDPKSSIHPHSECKACFSCVQGCTKGLLSMAVDPEYLAMGDEYWKPDIIATTWNQADAGRIPVSGAGYRGRFHGPGFDSIWTDMSEIVRPTRDGIHGREYISTSVDIGTKPMRLHFAPDGALETPPAQLIEIQLPALLDFPAWAVGGTALSAARAAAATALKTLAVIPAGHLAAVAPQHLAAVVPAVHAANLDSVAKLLAAVPMVEVLVGPATEPERIRDAVALAARVATHTKAIVAARLKLEGGCADTVLELARAGLKVLHLCADLHGREHNVPHPRYLKDTLREIHTRLVTAGLRDEVTLIAAGGIALPEHMAKAIICGADLVAVDTPLLIALGCRLCGRTHPNRKTGGPIHEDCPADIDSSQSAYAVQRMVNLMGAWHSQLIEVLGAMGIREVRRLRGEVGRAIFMEDIEKEAFGDLVRK